MAVNISLLAGAAAQFFDGNGNPLSGGKIYTYAAGTTTPQTTYTTSAGNVTHANPIILDSAGRVSSGGEIWLTNAVNYKFVIADSSDVVIGTYDDISGNGSGILSSLAASNGSSLIGFIQAESGAVARTVQSKLRESVSVFDFMTSAEIADVQAGTFLIDVSGAIQNAIDSGATCIFFPSGSYRVNSKITITSATGVRDIIGVGLVTLKLYTAVQASIFEVQPGKQFLSIKNLRLDSNGNKNDGLQTYGILTSNNAYSSYDNIRCTNFSGAGMEHRQCVYVLVNNYTCNSCFYGLSWQKYLGIQCTASTVNSAYISGCKRGLTQDDAVAMQYNQVILEYCGDAVSSDAAFHIDGGQCQANYLYCEVNERNILMNDASIDYVNKYILAATAPDIITYSGVPFNERGSVQVLAYEIQTPRLKPDSLTNRDLTIGENLVAPIAGGSVKWGQTTTERAAGAVTSGVWTTIYTVSGQTGDGAARKGYRYAVYAGRADLTTGYDTGVILNGVLYSDSGVTPAWLRISGNSVQLNITNTSYGLDYGISLMITNGIGAP